jgi:4-diphosphocytidyl-2-C-methyl-D-erythritol kinase
MSLQPLTIHAPAKVNLTLEVIRRRPDGFHDICSVMQAISLADELSLTPAGDLHLECDRPDLAGPDNLVWRAADLLRRVTGTRKGAAMLLRKNIPVAAGLGGGSSDAAAALQGLSALWQLHLSPSHLQELAAQLGSDVPFFLAGGVALAEGRGERLTALPPLPLCWLVLVKPPIGISAGAAYAALSPADFSDGSRTRRWLADATAHHTLPPPFNALEPAALRVAPAADTARKALLAAGADHALMSGSGSAFFSLTEAPDAARRIFERVREAGHEAYLASFLPVPADPRGAQPGALP